MNRLNRSLSVCLGTLLMLSSTLQGRAIAQLPTSQPGFTLSEEAKATALRFKTEPKGRLWADLEVVLKELAKPSATAAGGVEYQPISRSELLDLLGPPSSEGSDGSIIYGNSGYFETTGFFFEGGRLKSFVTLGESVVWYEPAFTQPNAAKRLWWKIVRLSRKIKGLF